MTGVQTCALPIWPPVTVSWKPPEVSSSTHTRVRNWRWLTQHERLEDGGSWLIRPPKPPLFHWLSFHKKKDYKKNYKTTNILPILEPNLTVMVLEGSIVTGDPWLTRSLTLILIGEIWANFTSGLLEHRLPRLRGYISSEKWKPLSRRHDSKSGTNLVLWWLWLNSWFNHETLQTGFCLEAMTPDAKATSIRFQRHLVA